MKALPILIAGAGIGGLTLAVALRRAGQEVLVLERSAVLKPVGAGLAIQPNALAALARLGLAEAVAAAGQAMDAAVIASAQGRVLSRIGMAQVPEAQGRLPVALHRATLQQLLLEALGPGALRLDSALDAWEASAEGVVVRLADGTHLAGRLLVGADGLRSQVRRQLLGDEALRYAGYSSWRGVCPRPQGIAMEAWEWWGQGLRFGHAPIDGDRSYWYATATTPAGLADGPDPQAELLARFAAFAEPIPTLLKATETTALLRTDIHDRPPIASWAQGRVVLLGDAAHPMTPNLGQGACQAIEDAVVLAEELGRHASHPEAFSAYQGRRLAKANGLVAASWRMGAVGQWAKPLACALRDGLMALTPEALLLRQVGANSRAS